MINRDQSLTNLNDISQSELLPDIIDRYNSAKRSPREVLEISQSDNTPKKNDESSR
jgi:hypothetical protein